MQRYFTDMILKIGHTFKISEEDFHHMKNVMRFKVNDEFQIVDATKTLYISKITNISDSIEAIVQSQENINNEMPIDVTIFSPLLKGEKLEWMLQKCTELGAAHFCLYEAERSIVILDEKKRNKKLERYQKIVKEAAEQSKRNSVPTVNFVAKLKCIDFTRFNKVYFAYESHAQDQSLSLSQHIDNDSNYQAFVFGPEGGFNDLEVEIMKPFTSVRLGPRILRAETAPIFFLSVFSASIE